MNTCFTGPDPAVPPPPRGRRPIREVLLRARNDALSVLRCSPPGGRTRTHLRHAVLPGGRDPRMSRCPDGQRPHRQGERKPTTTPRQGYFVGVAYGAFRGASRSPRASTPPKWSEVRERYTRGEGPRAASRDTPRDRSQSRMIEAGRDRAVPVSTARAPGPVQVTGDVENGRTRAFEASDEAVARGDDPAFGTPYTTSGLPDGAGEGPRDEASPGCRKPSR